VPELGAVFSHCGARAGCSALTAGSELGLSALYRATPFFAFGASTRIAMFDVADAESTRGHSLFAGVAGRVYFFEAGLWDPYLELALGGVSLAASHAARRGRLHDEVSFAPAARAAFGIDFALNPWLRLGPALAVARYAPRRVERCVAAACAPIEPASSALPHGLTSFGLRLTFASGETQ
jgi:hypothetical protein